MSTDVLIADTLPTRPELGRSEVAPCTVGSNTVGSNTVGSDSTEEQATSSESTIDAKRDFATIARDFLQLTKPRIVVMILVTTVATAMMGAGGLVSLSQLFWLLIGTGMVAGSAGAANQIWERVIDCRMARTANRPIPSGRMNIAAASIFTAILGIGGSVLLGQLFGAAPALAGIATWLLYVLVYTPMKTRTAWNTTVGAIAGALPVLIGYTAIGGTVTDASGWLLVGVLVAWQYPHFMAIAWMYRRQYDEAGFKMTTTVEPTGRSAGWQSISGSIVLIACGVALAWIPGFEGTKMIMAIVATLGVVAACYPMLKASINFAASPDDVRARKLLLSSLWVLPAVLLIVTLRVFF